MKKTINLFNRVLVALVLCAGMLAGCTEEPAPIAVTAVTLDTGVLELVEGETATLTATISPSNADNQKVVWSSDNSTIASVRDGVVTAVKPGSATVTVTTDDGGKTAECVVTVLKDSGPVTVSLEDVTATTATFTGHIDVDPSELSYSQVTVYYSSDETFNMNSSKSVSTTEFDVNQDFTIVLDGLRHATKYNYCIGVKVMSEEKFGEVKEFATKGVTLSLSVDESSTTATTALLNGVISGLSSSDQSEVEIGMLYSLSATDIENGEGTKKIASEIIDNTSVSFSLYNLTYATKYYFCSYVKQNGIYQYGEIKDFTTVNVVPEVSVVESSITATTASFSGTVTGLSEVDKSDIEVGMAYSSVSGDFQSNDNIKVASGEISDDGTYSMSMRQDSYDAIKYYYCSYILQNGVYAYGEVKEFSTKGAIKDLNMSSATDLSSSESANCYIVSQSGTYKFKTVKGNSVTSVGDVASCTILWESFGTSTTPELLSLISGVCYKDNYIAFQTPSTFTEGNAVIAAKDADGKILWSWHIWLTDQPAEHVYNNNAGTMMDRNLGATSATPGDVGALGLLYQWGRKDPFLGSSSISSSTVAKSTLPWPSAVGSTSETGTIDYVTANPTTFVTYNGNNFDWYYTGSSSTDNTRWQSSKTIYDPCPTGWRVPDGGSSGVWSKASGSGWSFNNTYDSTNEGMNFSGKFGADQTIWYPASGFRYFGYGGLNIVGSCGSFWSVTPYGDDYAYLLHFGNSSGVNPSYLNYRANGCAVRCLQESK